MEIRESGLNVEGEYDRIMVSIYCISRFQQKSGIIFDFMHYPKIYVSEQEISGSKTDRTAFEFSNCDTGSD